MNPRDTIKKLLREGGPELDVFMLLVEGSFRTSNGTASGFRKGLKSLEKTIPDHPMHEFFGAVQAWLLDLEADAFAEQPEPFEPMPFPGIIGTPGLPRFAKTRGGRFFNIEMVGQVWPSPEADGGAWIWLVGAKDSFYIERAEHEILVSLLDGDCTPLQEVQVVTRGAHALE
ncbi:MAG TPA: hypothetical protein VF768_05360 [Holophagaceae bacterium]